jgi:hypothetical protein
LDRPGGSLLDESVLRRLLGLALLCSITSCSFAFVPKVTPETKPGECRTGEGAVAVDTLAAVVAGAGTVFGGLLVAAAASDWDEEYAPIALAGAAIGVTSALAVFGFVTSARRGARHGRACRRLRAAE